MGPPKIGQTVVVEVPSTTANIGPGFDCLGAALDLSNYFTIRRIEGDGQRFELIMESTEGNHLRGGPENLFYRVRLGAFFVDTFHLFDASLALCAKNATTQIAQ